MAMKAPPSCPEWSIREQLCLASAVMRSGDQNWMSVSRAIKPFPEPGRPPDWNKPKNCAIQYSSMLGEVETPKRKRTGDKRDIVETPGDLIVKKMTFDRVEELKSMIADDKRKFKLLRDDIELIESGALDEKLPEILQDIHDLKKKRAAEAQKLAAEAAAAEIQDKKEQQRERLLLAYKSQQKQPEPDKKEESPKVSTVPAVKQQVVCNVTKDVLPTSKKDDSTKQGDTTNKQENTTSKQEDTTSEQEDATSKQVDTTSKQVDTTSKQVDTTSEQVATATKQKDTISKTEVATTEQEDTTTEQEDTTTKEEEATKYQGDSTHQEDSSTKSVKLSPTIPKPTTPANTPVLSNLLVTEKKKEKRTNLTPEILSDIQSILAKPSEEKKTSKPVTSKTTATEIPGPAEKTPTLSKLLTSTKSYQGQQPTTPSPTKTASSPTKITSAPTKNTSAPTKATPQTKTTSLSPKTSAAETKPVSTPTKAVVSAKDVGQDLPTVAEKDSTNEEVEVSVVDESLPQSPPSTHLLITKPVVENEDSSDISLIASAGPSSPTVVVKYEEQKKRKRGRPKKKRGVEDDNVEVQSVGESADETIKDEARSEAAESEETERPSESDRDDMSFSNLPLPGSFISESLPNSPASISQLDDNQRSWKKAIMLVWREAASHKFANLFLNPVTDDIAPGYSSVVYRRMDMSNIKKNIEAGLIKNIETFQRDIMVMFQNAIMYNRSDHDVYRMAVSMQSDVLKSIEEFKSTQLLVQNPEVSKILRGRERRTDLVQKDDEKKRSSLDPEHLTGKKRRTRADEV